MSEKRVKGDLHKHGEQLAVEIIRLSAVRTSKDGREQSHLLHNQVFICEASSIINGLEGEEKEVDELTADETSITGVKRTVKDQEKSRKSSANNLFPRERAPPQEHGTYWVTNRNMIASNALLAAFLNMKLAAIPIE